MKATPEQQKKLLEYAQLLSENQKIITAAKNNPHVATIQDVKIKAEEHYRNALELGAKVAEIEAQWKDAACKREMGEERIKSLHEKQSKGDGLTSRDLLEIDKEIKRLVDISYNADVEILKLGDELANARRKHAAEELLVTTCKADAVKAKAAAEKLHNELAEKSRQLQEQAEQVKQEIPEDLFNLYKHLRCLGGVGVREVNPRVDAHSLPLELRMQLERAGKSMVIVDEEENCILVRA